MEHQKAIESIKSLLVDLEKLPHRNESSRDALMRRANMIFTQVFGAGTQYLKDIKDINFYPAVYYSNMPDSAKDRSWASGSVSLKNLFNTALEQLILSGDNSTSHTEKAKPQKSNNEVFVVHGHDEELEAVVARTVEKLGLKPVILHEQANRGKTLIEKFIHHSDVKFAIVLFSPDDMAYKIDDDPKTARPRARQNVVLELGFFLGKLGRENVLVLFRQAEGFEIPSDYSGVVFTPYDRHGAWKKELVKELKHSGFDVDANRL